MIFKRVAVAGVSTLLFWGPAWGATVELVPKIGYGFHLEKDLANPNTQMKLGDNTVTGLSLGYLTKESGEVEVAWTHSATSARIDKANGAPSEQFDVKTDQLHFNMIYVLSPDAVQPFVLLGLGATYFSPVEQRSSSTRFSFAVGGGYKWLWNDHMGLRFEGLWTPVLAPSGSDFFCDANGNCVTTESNTYVSHILPFLNAFQFTAGLMLRV